MTYKMREATIGSKWTNDYRPLKDIAADIRADIKAAKKAGQLPTDIKVSVKTRTYAGGGAIDVRLSGWDSDRVWTSGYAPEYGREMTWLSDEANSAQKLIEEIRRSYNRDACDSMVDYFEMTYYGSTDWDWTTRP